MDTGNDLKTADRDTVIGIIVQQQALMVRQQEIIAGLEKRIAQLEGRAKSKGSVRTPGLKPKVDGKPAQPRKPRKWRSQGLPAPALHPPKRVERAVGQCPELWRWTC